MDVPYRGNHYRTSLGLWYLLTMQIQDQVRAEDLNKLTRAVILNQLGNSRNARVTAHPANTLFVWDEFSLS